MSRQKGQGCSLVPSVIPAVFPPSPQLFPAPGWSLTCLINLVTLLFNRCTPCSHTCGAPNSNLMLVYGVIVTDGSGVAHTMGVGPSHIFFFCFSFLLYPHFPGSASLLPGNLSSSLWPSPATSHCLCHWLPSSSIKSLYPPPMPVPVPHVSTLAASFLRDVPVSSLSDFSLRRWHT